MKRKRKTKTRTLGDLKVRRKVEVKPHSRKTRSGKRVVVKGYERGVSGSASHAQEVAKKWCQCGGDWNAYDKIHENEEHTRESKKYHREHRKN